MAGFKLTLIKGHTPENSYDGYAPHRHWELLNMSADQYLNLVVSKGLVYPNSSLSNLILSPWQLPWIRKNVKLVGYDFLEEVDDMYKGKDFYAFGDYHDGIDGQQVKNGPGTFITKVEGEYTNVNGKRATAEIYEVEVENILELWQTRMGVRSNRQVGKSREN